MKCQREIEREVCMQGLLRQRHGCKDKGIFHEGRKAMWIALVLCQMGSFVLETFMETWA